MKRTVNYVRLHQAIHLKDAGDIGNVFPAQGKTLENLSMALDSDILFINFTYRGLKKELAVHTANAVVMDLAPEPVKLVKGA